MNFGVVFDFIKLVKAHQQPIFWSLLSIGTLASFDSLLPYSLVLVVEGTTLALLLRYAADKFEQDMTPRPEIPADVRARLTELIDANKQLALANDALRRDLRAARRTQSSPAIVHAATAPISRTNPPRQRSETATHNDGKVTVITGDPNAAARLVDAFITLGNGLGSKLRKMRSK